MVNQSQDVGLVPISVRDFQAYRWRLPLTGFFLLSGFAIALMSKPNFLINGAMDQVVDLSGYSLIACGILVRLWAISAIDRKKTVHLVTQGPYSLCRNPLYVGTFLISLGFLCLVQSVSMLCLSLPIILLYLFGVVPAEEKVLENRHGKNFVDYKRSIPRWIPNSFSLKNLRYTPIWSRAAYKELQSAVWWFAIAAAVHLVCDLRAESWWMHPLNWP